MAYSRKANCCDNLFSFSVHISCIVYSCRPISCGRCDVSSIPFITNLTNLILLYLYYASFFSHIWILQTWFTHSCFLKMRKKNQGIDIFFLNYTYCKNFLKALKNLFVLFILLLKKNRAKIKRIMIKSRIL